MSRIGKKPVVFEKDIKVVKKDSVIEVTGPKGSLSVEMGPGVTVDINDNEVIVTRENDNKRNRALHGLYRALIQNMVTGVKDGFSKKLELVGIGYRAELKGNSLFLQLGYSHPVIFQAPADVKIDVPSTNTIVVSGIDKQLVGLVASKIKSFRKPEPYKGKGIKYEGEIIRRKAGKTASK
jgi:large subunit ribosomal protein L6